MKCFGFLSFSLPSEIQLLENGTISFLIQVFLHTCAYLSQGRDKNHLNRLPIGEKEIQARVRLPPYHYTEAAFLSMLHCYHMYELMIQSGCTHYHTKSGRSPLGNYYTAPSFHGQGSLNEDTYSLFQENKIKKIIIIIFKNDDINNN